MSRIGKGALRLVHPDGWAGVATPAAWTSGPGRLLLDSLPAMTVIVDERGDIAAANEAWRRFGRENGAGPAVAEGVGQNYFTIDGGAAMAGCPQDARAAAGIQRVLRGELPIFTLDYASRGPEDQRWFMLTVTPLDGGGAVIAHTDITARRRTEMSAAALIETGRELAGGLEPADVARQIASTVVRVFGTRHSTLYRLDREAGRLVCIAAAGVRDPEEWCGRTVLLGEGVVGRAAAEERSVWTPDLLDDPRIDLPVRVVDRAHADGFRSVLAVPLKAGDRVIGVLNLGDAAGRTYTEDELALLAAFVGQGAVALENSALYREVRDARDFLQSIAENSLDAIITADGLEEQLRQSQKMDAIGQLAGGIAHDFNNLLTVIAGRAELILSRLRPEEPIHRDATLIRTTVDRAAVLTHQLLVLSRKQVLQQDPSAARGGEGRRGRRDDVAGRRRAARRRDGATSRG
jgi:GAF domain-containing protein